MLLHIQLLGPQIGITLNLRLILWFRSNGKILIGPPKIMVGRKNGLVTMLWGVYLVHHGKFSGDYHILSCFSYAKPYAFSVQF